jgi:23S rRNA (adenine2030-N6)-methyltransferase
MLSYRHAFHAGNHADVLKHTLLLELLDYLNQKGPYWYIDTHAGAGFYALEEEYAQKNAEFETGIARLWQRSDLPAPLARYVDVVRELNPDGALRYYPGSPGFANAIMRPDDKLRLFELHPRDSQLLQENFARGGRRVQVNAADGFTGIKALLPPPTRRAITLIDPPYEDKRDYQRVVEALKEGLKRFATGTYAVWYPLLQRAEARQLPEKLKTLGVDWLDVQLTVRSPSADGFGMHGSGMFVLNPPWTLPKLLQPLMPYLVEALGEDGGAGFTLQHQIS